MQEGIANQQQLQTLQNMIAQREREITELKALLGQQAEQHQANLLETKNYYENIIALLPGHVYWLDRNNTILGCNDLQANNLGLISRQHIVGKRNIDFFGPEQAETLDKINNQVMQTGTSYVIEENVNMTQGPTTYLSQKVPLRNTCGEVIGLLGVSLDISDRKLLEKSLREAKEKAETANQAKTNFIATISHELRTPLNSIIGTITILLRHFQQVELQEHFHNIEASAAHLLNLVNDILILSRHTVDKLVVQQSLLDLHTLVKTVENDISPMADPKKIKLQYYCAPEISKTLQGDFFRLRQVLINLLSNAIKYTRQGKVSLTVSLLENNPDYQCLRFSVHDTGIGIPQEMHQAIFKKFFQIKENYNYNYGGVGLGLAIVKQILDAMQTTIQVNSHPGVGSAFWFDLKLPYSADGAALPNPVATKNELPPQEIFEGNILVVEDHPIGQKIIKTLLTDLGCHVDTAADGYEALKLITQHHYDVIFMDIGLPKMNGLETACEIRKMPVGQHLPIIALTAHVLDVDTLKFGKGTIDQVITKPITIKMLHNILSTYMPLKATEK